MATIRRLKAELAKVLVQNTQLVDALHQYGYDADFNPDGELHVHGVGELDEHRYTWADGGIEYSPTGEFIHYDIHLARLRELGVDV